MSDAIRTSLDTVTERLESVDTHVSSAQSGFDAVSDALDSLSAQASRWSSRILYALGEMGDPDTPQVRALREIAYELQEVVKMGAEDRAAMRASFQTIAESVKRVSAIMTTIELEASRLIDDSKRTDSDQVTAGMRPISVSPIIGRTEGR